MFNYCACAMRHSNSIAFANTRRLGSLAWDLETNILTPGWERRKTALMKQLDELFQDLSPSQLSPPGSCYYLVNGFVLMKQIQTEGPSSCSVSTLVLLPAEEVRTLSAILTGNAPPHPRHPLLSLGVMGEEDVSCHSVRVRESPNPGFIISGVAGDWTSAPKGNHSQR